MHSEHMHTNPAVFSSLCDLSVYFFHFKRKLLLTTLTLLNAIAAPAIIGSSKNPLTDDDVVDASTRSSSQEGTSAITPTEVTSSLEKAGSKRRIGVRSNDELVLLENSLQDAGFTETRLCKDSLQYFGLLPPRKQKRHSSKSKVAPLPTASVPIQERYRRARERGSSTRQNRRGTEFGHG